jgi:hypothetical protein
MNIKLLILNWVLIGLSFGVNITFQVDMRDQNVSMYGVHIAGSNAEDWSNFGFDSETGDTLPAWDPSVIELLDLDADGIYDVTLDLTPEFNYEYKFVNGNAWGFDEISLGGNRVYTTGTEPVSVDVVCFESFDACITESPTLTAVQFRVDMREQSVSELGIHIAGSNTTDLADFGYNPLNGDTIPAWSPGSVLCLLEEDLNSANVFVITYNLVPGYSYEYKFINGNDWGMDEPVENNRTFTVSPVAGMIVPEVCFGAQEDCPDFLGGVTLSSLTFSTDAANAIANNGFSVGETMVVKWGYGGTQSITRTDTLLAGGFGTGYTVTIDSVEIELNNGLFYQYYKSIDGNDFREVYFNFEYDGTDVSLAERRNSNLSGAIEGQSFFINDHINSNVDQNRQPIFMDTDPIGSELTVTWTVDIRPAYYQVLMGTTLEDIQGVTDIEFPEQVFEWGVWMNGPATTPANGESWTQWGATLWNTEEKQMWDDGTHGDIVAGDSVYSVQFTYQETDTKGQEFKFGIKGGDNESGYGLNHIENIDVSNPIVNSFWGSINPFFYNAWDFDTDFPLDISSFTESIPKKYNLGDNYPNPFNPVTEFEFSIPERTNVQLSVFNLSGQFIVNLKSENLSPGSYKVKWNGMDFRNKSVPSGIYIYEIKTDSGIRLNKKMTLLK